MSFFRITYLCPDCGRLHRITVPGETANEAMGQFLGFWRELDEKLGLPVQLPLLNIGEPVNAEGDVVGPVEAIYGFR